MLNADIKRQINTVRDILVGKIPDPKGQIDQITNALIYKFMDDQDRIALTLPRGKATFFVGDLEPFAWHKLFASKLSNQDRANLYVEGIAKLSKAKNLPELFRDIFKDAFLPFRAPDTIAMFLDEINKFDYQHSEDLGNAFEYLLSIMGSQGDAGQFRTPRNIIEFIVDAVDPTKDESILDPACGTAGFLVEAYNHITEGSKLSQNEIQELSKHIHGVDIDPGMAKIARVNLYLHGFKTPLITENDTLSNEKLWGTKYDVILANPPFMTPTGGIRPHDRFSIQANRAEVLFTDYIAEHLKLSGRAGIVVPEGIISTMANAYKQLRKMLVEDNYLWAVISLPAGVFNPYSGVKTSILLLDRKRASGNDEILFYTVEHDGFDLGAQRRGIKENDLPEALMAIVEWKNSKKINSKNIAYVAKEAISESGDYYLSASRYQRGKINPNAKWPTVELQEVVTSITPPAKISKTNFQSNGSFPIIDQSQDEISGWTNDESVLVRSDKPLVVFGDHTCAVKYTDRSFAQGADGIKILRTNEQLVPRFLYHVLKNRQLESEGYKRHFAKLKRYELPLPPLEIQMKIIEELDGYEKIISGAKQIVENWKPRIEIDPVWEMVRIGELVGDMHQGVNTAADKIGFESNGFPIIQARDITSGTLNIKDTKKLSENDFRKYKEKYNPNVNDVLLSNIGTVGKSVVINKRQDFIIAWNVFILKLGKKILPDFLKICFDRFDSDNYWQQFMTGGTVKFINKKTISDTEIPLPPLVTQTQIVEKIEAERTLVEGSKKLIEIYEQKTKDAIAKLWKE